MEKIYMGVDIGGMSVKAGLVNTEGHILVKDTCRTLPERPSSDVIADIAALLDRVAVAGGYALNDLSGIGIGVPGTVNSEKGIVTYSGNLNFVKVNVLQQLSHYTTVPLFIGNDANCAALGETEFGSGGGRKNSVLVTLGTGVGTGFILDGKIFEGMRGEGAEGGHILMKLNGEKCTCGERGCWEVYASATALINQTVRAIEKHPESKMTQYVQEMGRVSGRTAFLAYKDGDKVGTKVVKDYVNYVARGIITLVNIFRPEIVMVGGGVSHEGDYFINMVNKIVQRHSFGGKNNTVPSVVRATLGNDAGLIGAAALAMQR